MGVVMVWAFAKSARAKFARVRGKCVQIWNLVFFPKNYRFFVKFCGLFELWRISVMLSYDFGGQGFY